MRMSLSGSRVDYALCQESVCKLWQSTITQYSHVMHITHMCIQYANIWPLLAFAFVRTCFYTE